MPLNWNVPLRNGTDIFFTEESLNKLTKCSTFEERFLKNLEDYEAYKESQSVSRRDNSQKKTENSVTETSSSIAADKLDLRAQKTTSDEHTKSVLAANIAKSRLPPPRKSSLSHADQRQYLSLYSKYGCHSPADPTEEEITELNILKALQQVVNKEREAYHVYARSRAQSLFDEYRFMNTEARKYMEERLTARQKQMEMYPSHYNTTSNFPLACTGKMSHLTYVKPLLEMGSVSRMVVPMVTLGAKQPLPIDVGAVRQEYPIMPPKTKGDNWNHEVCSFDKNAEVLAVQNRGHIVISPGALMCLVDNHAPGYNRGWELPFTVREYEVIEGDKKILHRVVYVDKPFVQKNITERDKNTKFYKFLLKQNFCRHHPKTQGDDNKHNPEKSLNTSKTKNVKVESKQNPQHKIKDNSLVEGDIFDLGGSTMEDVETFGTANFESFPKSIKSKVSSFEDIDTKGSSKSQKFVMPKLEKFVKTLPHHTKQTATETTSSTGLDNVQKDEGHVMSKPTTSVAMETPTSPGVANTSTGAFTPVNKPIIAATVDTSVHMTLRSSESGQTRLDHYDAKDSLDNSVALESTISPVDTSCNPDIIDTPANPVVIDTSSSHVPTNTQSSPVAMDTPASPFLKDTPSSPVAMDTPASPVAMDTPAGPAVTDTPLSPVAMDTPASPVVMDTPASPSVTDTPVSPVAMDTPASPVVMDTPASPSVTDTPVSPVAMDTPTSPEAMIASPGTKSCNMEISTEYRNPKIIPLCPSSPDKQSSGVFHSPDTRKCVIIPLQRGSDVDEEVVVDNSQADQPSAAIASLPATPPKQRARQRKIRKPVHTPALSDLDSDDEGQEKLFIDISSQEDSPCEETESDHCKGTKVKVKSKLVQVKGNSGEKMSITTDSDASSNDQSNIKITRSRQSLDSIMTQMETKPGVRMTRQKTDSFSSGVQSTCELKTEISDLCVENMSFQRSTRSRTRTAIGTNMSVCTIERSEVRSTGSFSSSASRDGSLLPESDSESSTSVDLSTTDCKVQGSKVKRRSPRISSNSMQSCTEERETGDNSVSMGRESIPCTTSDMATDFSNTDSKVKKIGEGNRDDNSESKNKGVEEVSIVPRKRGRPRKMPLPSESPVATVSDNKESVVSNIEHKDDSRAVEECPVNPTPPKRKRGRPPKQNVYDVHPPVIKDNSNEDKGQVDMETADSPAELDPKAKKGLSTTKMKTSPEVEPFVSKVKPKMVATLIPKSDAVKTPTAKQITKPKDRGQSSSTRRSSAGVSTFDTILQGMQDMLHKPDQKVGGPQEPNLSSPSMDTSPFKQPTGQSNVSYHLWSLGGFQVVVRCCCHGTIKDSVQKVSNVHLSTKMEYQSVEGLEQVTPSETSRSWISGYIRPHCKLLRARIDPLKSELLAIEEVGLNQLIGSQQVFRPANAFLLLQNVFHKLHLQSPGQYLLNHKAGSKTCEIKKSTENNKRGSYDLHFEHFGFMSATGSHNKTVPWLPIDPSIVMPHHIKLGRVPATFEPRDFAKWNPHLPKNKKKGKKKKQK